MSSFFPEEIMVDVLLRLPVKSICRFRCVCKLWCKLLSSDNHDFVKMHLNHNIENNNTSFLISNEDRLYSRDYCDSSSSSLSSKAVEIKNYPFKSPRHWVEILGSCNGLLCITQFRSFEMGVISIWNPCTKEYKGLPSPPPAKYSLDAHSKISYGFGYDCKIGDYKLVRIVPYGPVNVSGVVVFSLASNSWKRIQSIPHGFQSERVRGVLVNGTLHWIVIRRIGSNASRVIISFDIGDERFQDIQPPNSAFDKLRVSIGLLGRSLCLFGSNDDDVDVWVMKEYGVIESWTKLYIIPQRLCMRPIRPVESLKNGEIVLVALVVINADDRISLVSYDPKHENGSTLKIGDSTWFDSESYVGSLLSLNSGTYVEDVEQNKKRKHKKRRRRKTKRGMM